MKASIVILFFIPILGFSQFSFTTKSQGCYVRLDFFELPNKKNTPGNYFQLKGEIINYDSTIKYFPIAGKDTSKNILVNFTEISAKVKLISFYIGSCNEDNFPYNCMPDTFNLKALLPKQKINFTYLFKSSKNISYFIEECKINFQIRFLDGSHMALSQIAELGKIFYTQYLRASKLVFLSFESKKYLKFIEDFTRGK